MCSKMFQWGCLLYLLTSCSYFFGNKEDQNKKGVFELSIDEKAGVSCVKDNTELLRAYFNMERDDEQIRKDLITMKGCLKDAVLLFVRHTTGGEDLNSYENFEIHDFLTSSFDTYTYANTFMEEAFRLKVSLIGGDPRRVSKAEILTLLNYIEFAYDKLAYHASDRHYIFSNTPQHEKTASQKKYLERDEFHKAAQRLQETLSQFNTLPLKSQGTFDYASFVRLVGYFMDGGLTKHWSDAFKIVNSLQSIISHGQKDSFEITQLQFLINNLGTMYVAYAEFQNFLKEDETKDESFFKDISTVLTFPGLVNSVIKRPDVFIGERLEALTSVQNNILNPLRNGLAAAPDQQISIRYLEEFIDTIDEIDALPSYAQGKTLKTMIPKFFGHWLASQKCTTDIVCSSQFVTVDNIDTLLTIVKDWRERQDWVNKVVPLRGLKSETMGRQRGDTTNIQSFQDILSRLNHMHWEEYVVIGSKEVNYKDLVIFNNIYTLVEIFTRPFNVNRSKKNSRDYFMTRDQTQKLFEWFRDLGVELNFIDPRSLSSGATAFIEINIFGSTSFAPSELNFTEMIEYMEISISTGLRSVKLVRDEFVSCQIEYQTDDGKTHQLRDVFDFVKLKADCVRPIFEQNIDKFLFSSMPGLVKYLKNSTDANLPLMLTYLEKAARQGTITDEPMDTDMFRLSSSITQYAEAIFLRFDKDKNDVMNSTELRALLDHIIPSISMMIKDSLDDNTEGFIYGVFPNFEENLITYILDKKTTPAILTADTTGGGLVGAGDLALFNTWAGLTPGWWKSEPHLTREDIFLVVASLSYFQRINRIKTLKSVLWDNDFKFDDPKGITDKNDEVFTDIMNTLQCSSKISTEVRQWLYDSQKDYWLKELSDTINVAGITIHASDIPGNQFVTNWTDAVTARLVALLYRNPQLGHLCGLPYIDGIQTVRASQSPTITVRNCAKPVGARRWCPTKEVYQVYGP